jgi:predicted permease
MNLFAPISSWWRALARRSQTDSGVEDELQFHIDAHANHLIDSGIAPAEAMRQAKVEFGRVDVQKEKYGAAIGLRPLYEIGGDIRYGIRSLYRHPWISVAAVISLALGIGATTAMFNVIYSALLHPFPYADVDRIVNPALTNDKHPDLPTWFALTPPQYASFVQAKSIDSVLGFMLAGMQETGGQLPEDVSVAFVTSNIDSFLKAPPFIGRGIQPADASQNVVVLSYKYWNQRFGGDTSVIGHALDLNHQSYTIAGVMPSRFAFTQTVGNADVYIPWNPTRSPGIFPWIKLKPGVTPESADAEFQSFLNKFKQETPQHFPDSFHVNVQQITAPYVHRLGQTLTLLFVSVVFLLLIGCANCSVLLLARGEARQHELSVRSAIGAGRFRIVRQLLIESLAIAFTGAALGTALSYWLAKLPMKLMPNAFPQEATITLNWPILIFSVALALITGILFGLAPAFRLSRPDVSHMMQSRERTISGTGNRSLNFLIGGQIALTLLLLGVAGAAVGGLLRITSTKLGYDPHNVGFIGIPLQRGTGKNQPPRAAYIEHLRERVATVPGVGSVAVLASGIPPSQPFGGSGTPADFEILGHQSELHQQALVQLVSPEYFATLKIPLLSGRLWTEDENRRADFVAIVNQTFAQRYLPKRNALDLQIRTDGLKDDGRPQSAVSPYSGDWRQIIGVVADSRNDGLERPTLPAIYVPYTAFMWDATQLFIRTTDKPLTFLRPLRAAIHSFNRDQRVSSNGIGELDEVLEHQPIWMQQRLLSILFSFFGGIALTLSLLGIASTVLFSTTRRRNELGIRMALGARRGHIIWTVSRTTLSTIGCGIFIGLLLNVFLQKLLEHWMPGNNPAISNFAPVAALLLGSSAIACLVPAARAAYVNPMQTLRSD